MIAMNQEITYVRDLFPLNLRMRLAEFEGA